MTANLVPWICGVLALACSSAAAQELGAVPRGQKSVRIVRAATPPVIDGVLDEAAWSAAAMIDDLHQVQPTEYAEASEPTLIYLMYDEDALYVGARMYDRQPEQITARILRQGGETFGDDWFAVIVDPFFDRRSGYRFQTNPNGLRQEALFENVSEEQWDWQGIWYAATSIDDEGWLAEMAIPFKSLSFDSGNRTWGINFGRAIARRDEQIAWVSRNRSTDPSTSGTAIGFEGLEQGAGLDIVPSLTLTDRRDFETGRTESGYEPALDVFYKLTPSMTGSLTVNTDFSATEVDDRQVNLSRFELFLPEKRDFFLQDADIFAFGRLDENGRPFFSRRIGLGEEGQIIDVAAGGKISGRVGRWNIGTLSIRQEDSLGLDADNATVARLSANVLEESSAGFILTEGSPQSNLDNSLFGADFLYRNTRLPGGRLVEAEAWLQQSDTEGLADDDRAFGVGVSSPNNTGFRGGLRYSEFEENFNPGLGFVNRSGVRQVNSSVQYTHRPTSGYLRSIEGGVEAETVELLAGGLQSQEIEFELLVLESRQGDSFRFERGAKKEVLDEPFEIYPGIAVPNGSYTFYDWRLNIETAEQRKLAGGFVIQDGSFLSGDLTEMEGFAAWRPSGHFSTRLSYSVNEVDLPQGSFTTRLLAVRTDIVFSSKLSWVNLIQYDNVSEVLGINSRLQWIPQAGREGFLVLNHNIQDYDRDNSFHSAYSEAAIKFNYTFRF